MPRPVAEILSDIDETNTHLGDMLLDAAEGIVVTDRVWWRICERHVARLRDLAAELRALP